MAGRFPNGGHIDVLLQARWPFVAGTVAICCRHGGHSPELFQMVRSLNGGLLSYGYECEAVTTATARSCVTRHPWDAAWLVRNVTLHDAGPGMHSKSRHGSLVSMAANHVMVSWSPQNACLSGLIVCDLACTRPHSMSGSSMPMLHPCLQACFTRAVPPSGSSMPPSMHHPCLYASSMLDP